MRTLKTLTGIDIKGYRFREADVDVETTDAGAKTLIRGGSPDSLFYP